MERLKGKTALITGGARGIGKEIATTFINEGAKVIIADINKISLKTTAENIGADYINMDVSKIDSINSAINYVWEQYNGIDILINNAAIFDMAPIVEITHKSYEKLFSINFAGTLFTMQSVCKLMIKNNRAGKIINMASQAGRRGEALVGIYCATKAAVISITQSAGLDLIKYGINVNAIAPGVVEGDHWKHVDKLFAKYENRPIGEKEKIVGNNVPYGRMGKATDLVGMAIFLATHESDYIVGQTFNVDGGNWMN